MVWLNFVLTNLSDRMSWSIVSDYFGFNKIKAQQIDSGERFGQDLVK